MFRRGSRIRTSGTPPSANGASSFHLFWALPAAMSDPLVTVSADLTVVLAPAVDRLYFWALQASFTDRGRETGGGHLGLQWHPEYPGGTAANWGGYSAAGRELAGSESPLPGTLGNPNTRDFVWRPGNTYRLTIGRHGDAWRGTIADVATGAATVVRDLHCGGSGLVRPMVWSEVFARCDDPQVVVRWKRFRGSTGSGEEVSPGLVGVNYQSHADGGCGNTTAAHDPDPGFPDALLQITNSERIVPQGATLPVR